MNATSNSDTPNKGNSNATALPALVSVYVIFADKEEAIRIGRSAIEARLAACLNILGTVDSIYRWENQIETTEECAALFKTTAQKADALMTHIASQHSYDVPAITLWPVGAALPAYAHWVMAETKDR